MVETTPSPAMPRADTSPRSAQTTSGPDTCDLIATSVSVARPRSREATTTRRAPSSHDASPIEAAVAPAPRIVTVSTAPE